MECGRPCYAFPCGQVFATIFQKAVKVVDEARKVEEIAQKVMC